MAKRLPFSESGFDLYLSVGHAVSIQGRSGTLAATVAAIRPNKLRLKLSRSTSRRPLQKRDRVQIKYWDKGGVYRWNAHVDNVPALQKVVVSRHGSVTVQRRESYRVRSAISFSFTVIDAAETDLVGEHVSESKTENVSIGGLTFDTSLRLTVGDKLEMNLHLSPSQQVNAVGWVVRSESVVTRSVTRVALKFLQLNEKEQRYLLQFLVKSRN